MSRTKTTLVTNTALSTPSHARPPGFSSSRRRTAALRPQTTTSLAPPNSAPLPPPLQRRSSAKTAAAGVTRVRRRRRRRAMVGSRWRARRSRCQRTNTREYNRDTSKSEERRRRRASNSPLTLKKTTNWYLALIHSPYCSHIGRTSCDFSSIVCRIGSCSMKKSKSMYFPFVLYVN